MKTEKEWVTEAGLKAQVVATPMGHRCGYVSVPAEHPMYEKHYDDVAVDVHGGLTYADRHDGSWWLGYDCAHLGDARDPELMSDKYKEAFSHWSNFTEGTIRTLDFCVAECESLAKQLGEMKK
jgi:hypothetical protein